MPVSVYVECPNENEVEIDPFLLEAGFGSVTVKGRGNIVKIERPLHAGTAHFFAENGSEIIVEEGCVLGSLYAYALAAGASIHIGAGTGFTAATYITAHEPARVRIGRECLFAPDCAVASSDVHKIFDIATGERLNPAGDILIGDRVWFGGRSTVLKNAVIGSDSIVGWGSLVRGHFPANTMIAGSPARIIRSGVRWER